MFSYIYKKKIYPQTQDHITLRNTLPTPRASEPKIYNSPTLPTARLSSSSPPLLLLRNGDERNASTHALSIALQKRRAIGNTTRLTTDDLFIDNGAAERASLRAPALRIAVLPRGYCTVRAHCLCVDFLQVYFPNDEFFSPAL